MWSYNHRRYDLTCNATLCDLYKLNSPLQVDPIWPSPSTSVSEIKHHCTTTQSTCILCIVDATIVIDGCSTHSVYQACYYKWPCSFICRWLASVQSATLTIVEYVLTYSQDSVCFHVLSMLNHYSVPAAPCRLNHLKQTEVDSTDDYIVLSLIHSQTNNHLIG